MARAGVPIETRLWERVIAGAGGCILFVGSRRVSGHGQIHYAGRNRTAHQVAWELANGPIPVGKQINHTCDVAPCVNLRHLYLGTQQENISDAVTRGRSVKGSATGTAVLTEDDALAIFRAPGRQIDIARDFGVSRSTVYMIKAGKNWAWLTQLTERAA